MYNYFMKKIIFIEGLPTVGKTYLVNEIRKKNMQNVYVVDELINPDINNAFIDSEDKFLKNDEMKVNKYNDTIFITTNYRVLVENDWLDDLKYICEPTEFHEKRISVRWTCDRGVSHEFVRHRVFSFAQESTRYCNYSKDKFNNELTFIIPTWLTLPEGNYTYWDGDWVDIDKQVIQVSENDISTHSFLNTLECSEYQYTMLINAGWKPQQARQILPNALKTELVMTGFESDWKHFFELRCDTAAHPDARKLALELYKLIYNKEYGKE